MEKPYIFCIDDQREVLLAVARDLKRLDEWTVLEECESVSEARELLDDLAVEAVPVALVVCDHIMPGMSGVEFLTELDRDRRFLHLKKVLLTGQATHKDTIAAVNDAHIDFYFEKPWQPDAFVGTCRRLISEYLFDSGGYHEDFRRHMDPQVLLTRLRGRE